MLYLECTSVDGYDARMTATLLNTSDREDAVDKMVDFADRQFGPLKKAEWKVEKEDCETWVVRAVSKGCETCPDGASLIGSEFEFRCIRVSMDEELSEDCAEVV